MVAREGVPLGSFLFLGPTGVGKTELAKALAAELFDDDQHMIRIDCRCGADISPVYRVPYAITLLPFAPSHDTLTLYHACDRRLLLSPRCLLWYDGLSLCVCACVQ